MPPAPSYESASPPPASAAFAASSDARNASASARATCARRAWRASGAAPPDSHCACCSSSSEAAAALRSSSEGTRRPTSALAGCAATSGSCAEASNATCAAGVDLDAAGGTYSGSVRNGARCCARVDEHGRHERLAHDCSAATSWRVSSAFCPSISSVASSSTLGSLPTSHVSR